MIKDIPGYEGIYQISDQSEVICVKTGLVKKCWISNKGYKCIDLSKDGKTTHKLLHRLMAEAFVPNPNNYPIVMHKDNNKLNTDPDNLAWGTYSENNAQAVRDGLKCVPKPDNRGYFVITYENSDCINPLIYHGLNEVVKDMGYGNNQVAHNIVHRHDKIKQGFYKGCYVERYKM